MAAFHPKLADLPAEIPVFPLPGALLLPQGRLPLNIFEPRYLAMVEDSLAAGRMFGMIQPDVDTSEEAAGARPLARIGCLGRLTSFAETEDGRFLITLTGVTRFAVARELPMRRGYRRVEADYSAFAADLDLAEPPPPFDRAELVAALRPYFRTRGIEANWEAVEQTSDAMLVITLCMVCPFEEREKQALLEVSTPAERAELLTVLLQMGAHAGSHPGPPAGSRPS